MNQPIVSVLIPTFNYARYLPEAIESVLEQDFPDFELLIADDCSTDNTREVVEKYCARDPRLRLVVHSRNVGMVTNWNYCLQQACGEYIKYVFGDDRLYSPRTLRRMVDMMKADRSATLAASARIILDESSRVVNLWRDLKEGSHDGRRVIIDCLMKNGQNLVGEPSAVLFRKSDAQRGFNPAYKQIVDVEMWFHLLEKGNLVYTQEPLCAFRCHSSQQTEINSASGEASREHIGFFTSYLEQPWLPARVAAPYLFHLRVKLRKRPDANQEELTKLEQRLVKRLGKHPEWVYWSYYFTYRITKPFLNLYYSIQKRLSRRHYRMGK